MYSDFENIVAHFNGCESDLESLFTKQINQHTLLGFLCIHQVCYTRTFKGLSKKRMYREVF